MHHVERAVIIAAGEGRRLRPLTLDTPKPLLRVNGKRFIDTIIGALHSNGIAEIYVVTGYLAEQYAALPEQYPGVTLLYNPYYATCNNISSAYVARAHLENAIISEADLLVFNDAVCESAFARSCYCAIPIQNAPEWSLSLDGDGTIRHCLPGGGEGSHQLVGVSLWTAEDGRRLCGHLEQAFMRDMRRDIFWDELVLFRHADEYSLGIREIASPDLAEIDTLEELAEKDAAYAAHLHRSA